MPAAALAHLAQPRGAGGSAIPRGEPGQAAGWERHWDRDGFSTFRGSTPWGLCVCVLSKRRNTRTLPSSLYLPEPAATSSGLPFAVRAVCSHFSGGRPASDLPGPHSCWHETLPLRPPSRLGWGDRRLLLFMKKNVNGDKSYFYNVFIYSMTDINNT